jgi:hypothetical protein
MRVYLATAFSNWPEAKRVRGLLFDAGVDCSSSWIDVAEERAGKDAAVSEDKDFARECYRRNYADLDASDALLMLRVDGAGEAFFEAAYAMFEICIPVLWVGKPLLTITAHVADADVKLMPSAEDAVAQLAWMSKHRRALK